MRRTEAVGQDGGKRRLAFFGVTLLNSRPQKLFPKAGYFQLTFHGLGDV